jgi:hypothetical protein
LAIHLLLLNVEACKSTGNGESEVGAVNSVIEYALMEIQETCEPNRARRWQRILQQARQSRIAAKLQSFMRFSLRFFAAVLGLGLLGYLVFRTGPGVVWNQLQAVGWGLALIIILGGFSQFIKTCAWRQAFTCDISQLSWSRSFVAQLISDAIGQLGVAGKVIGEGMRISLLGSTVPVSSALSAGAIDGGLHGFSAVVVTVLGISATLMLGPVSVRWRVYAGLLIAGLASVVILAGIAIAHRRPLIGNAIRAIGRLPRLHNWVSGKQPIIDSAEHNLLNFHREAPAAFWATLMLNVMWHALAVLEVYVVLRFMGAGFTIGGAFIVEGLTKVINLVGALNPGNFGTYEAGNMLIAKMFGVTSTAGLTLALSRRARTVFWAGVGAVCVVLMKRTEAPRTTTLTLDPAGEPSNGEKDSANTPMHGNNDLGFDPVP